MVVLNFSHLPEVSSAAVLSGISQGVSVGVLYIDKGATEMSRTRLRSAHDSLWTGPMLFAGDHECQNTQVFCTLEADTRITGKNWSVATDTMLAASSRTLIWCEPDDGCVFTYATMLARLGNDTSKELMWVQCRNRSMYQSGIYDPTANYWLRSHARKIDGSYYTWFEYTAVKKFGSGISAPLLTQAYSLNRVYYSASSASTSYGASIYASLYARLSSDAANFARKFYYSISNGWSTTMQKLCTLSTFYPVSAETYNKMYASPAVWMDNLGITIPTTGPFIPFFDVYPSASSVGTYVPYTLTAGTSADADDARKRVDEIASLNPALSGYSDRVDWGELCDVAVDNIMDGTTSWVANAKDLKTTGATLLAIVALLRNAKNPKSWANAFLSLRYGDRLTFADAMSTMRDILYSLRSNWKKDFQVAYSTASEDFVDQAGNSHHLHATVKVYYKPASLGRFGDIYRFATKWGLWPSTETAWDVIPFSFVVDWFADIGAFFHDFDRSIYMEYITVLSVSRSLVDTCTISDESLSGYTTTGITTKRYDRRIGKSLLVTPFRVDRGHSTAIDAVTGAALVAQIIL